MINVNQTMFAEGQAVLIRECEFTAAQLDDIINHASITSKFKEDCAKVETNNELGEEAGKAMEEFSTTHLQNKTNIDNPSCKPNGKVRAEGSENKYINLVVLRRKKKATEKRNSVMAVASSKKDSKTVSTSTVALCSMCGKNFSSNYNLKRHMASCKLCPEDEKGPRFQCQCGRTYSQEWDMKKHKLSCRDNSKKCKSCLFPFCNLLFYHRSQLLAHMKNVHNVSIRDPEVIDFDSIDDFKLWKEKVEEDTYTYYSKQTGSNVTGVSVNTYYVCQHDGSDRTHSSAPRKTERRNKKGRVKTGRFCWSQMNVKEFRDGSVRVTYHPSHTHPISAADTEHHPLPSSITSEIQRRLTEMGQDGEETLAAEYPEFKKSRKKSYAMNVRTLRALARKNRKLFRITAEAIEGADDMRTSEEIEELPLKKEEEGSLLLVPAEGTPSVEEEEANQLKPEDVVEISPTYCNTLCDQLKELISSGRLSESALSQVFILSHTTARTHEVPILQENLPRY